MKLEEIQATAKKLSEDENLPTLDELVELYGKPDAGDIQTWIVVIGINARIDSEVSEFQNKS